MTELLNLPNIDEYDFSSLRTSKDREIFKTNNFRLDFLY